MIHLLLSLIFFSVSKNKWCVLHNLKCTNILSIWLFKKALQTQVNLWRLPHETQSADAGPYSITYCHCTIDRPSVLMGTTGRNPESPLTTYSSQTFSCPSMSEVYGFLSYPTADVEVSNWGRLAPRLCSVPNTCFFLVQITSKNNPPDKLQVISSTKFLSGDQTKIQLRHSHQQAVLLNMLVVHLSPWPCCEASASSELVT